MTYDTPPTPQAVGPDPRAATDSSAPAAAVAPGTAVPAAMPADPSRPARGRAAPVVEYDRVPWKRVGLYCVIAYAFLAICAAPFWFLREGIAHPLFTPLIGLGMFGPLIASLIVTKAVEKTSWRTRVGLRFRGRWKTLLLWSVAAVVIVLAVNALGVLISGLRGVPLSLTDGYAIRTAAQQISEKAGQTISPTMMLVITLVQVPIGLIITTVLTFGEEVGWRGWLWPALKPIGRVRATLVGGVIWGLWHLPILVIGYNYPGVSRWIAIPMFLVFCTAMAALLGAITDRAGGSPIPAAWAHGTLNSTATLFWTLFATAQTAAHVSTLIDTLLGAIGIVMLLGVGAALMPWRTRLPAGAALPSYDPGERGALRG